ncbi:MAG: anion permease [Rhodospirillales bacterium]|jgi:PiT family inorganic phosphate transporter|nr:anion permease [Rhodospirillales bacterium]MDP6643939.1 anion permease [Rhodospirillales bacterium]MDP6841936.1 anion permease [Rhodospirillales bacterium]|tara:strand:- start:363 stop:1901 length:1539 start_codon:yes stop_codon:yes gene_type:complete
MKLPTINKKATLDKDLKKFVRIEQATLEVGQQIVKAGIGLLFLVVIWVIATIGYYDVAFFPVTKNAAFVVAAGIIGGYMALNIGANDVANNVGPAVGSKALTLAGALVIAAIFETAGALLAGGDVVSTIKKDIIDIAQMPDAKTFIHAMMAALLAAALWLNLATYVGAPVSTTHSIVGGVIGAGIAATGLGAVNWITMSKIIASWVISPVLGGLIAAAFLAFIKFFIYYQDDMIRAAKRWVPVLVAIMGGVFSIYLVMKGLKKIWSPEPWIPFAIGAGAFIFFYAVVRPIVNKTAERLENRRKDVSILFTIPLICSAALLSFAHGANDVANAVGPLAAIVSAASSGAVDAKVGIPLWVMIVGAVGISAGLVLFGPKLIRTVGEQITRLDRARAFTVALSAAITVIVASALGLPVSSTHIAIGGVFGIGFLREYLDRKKRREKAEARRAAEAIANGETGAVDWGKQRRKLYKIRGRKLVRRKHLITIIAAWLVTVPLSAILAAILFAIFRLFT